MDNESPESLDSLRCLRCRGEMVAGWVPEHDGFDREYARLMWFRRQSDNPESVAVSPLRRMLQKCFRTTPWADTLYQGFTGSNVPPGFMRGGLPIVTMRCVRCGYLESYANPKEDKKNRD